MSLAGLIALVSAWLLTRNASTSVALQREADTFTFIGVYLIATALLIYAVPVFRKRFFRQSG